MPLCPYRSLLALLLILVVALPVAGQQAPESSSPAKLDPNSATSASAHADRPKIGVALEGGGALGLAHIGVLQWFEDHHIPIDYIAGTSMGGLVGGLYASGKSPDQLRELVAQQNWDMIIGGRTQYPDLSFRRKEDLRAYPNSLVVGLKDGLTLPAGLNAGQEISLLIDRETLPYSRLKFVRSVADPFPLCRHRPYFRKGNRLPGRLARQGDACHHVHSRTFFANSRWGKGVCRWRACRKSSYGRRAKDGRRYRHRGSS